MRFDVISWDQTTNNLKKPRLDLCIRKSGKPNRTCHSSRYLKKEIGFLGKRRVPLDCTRDIGNQVSPLRHLEKAVRLSEALVLLQDTLITRQPAQQKGEQAIQPQILKATPEVGHLDCPEDVVLRCLEISHRNLHVPHHQPYRKCPERKQTSSVPSAITFAIAESPSAADSSSASVAARLCTHQLVLDSHSVQDMFSRILFFNHSQVPARGEKHTAQQPRVGQG